MLLTQFGRRRHRRSAERSPFADFATLPWAAKIHGFSFTRGAKRMAVLDWVSGRVFKFVHGNNLVYNTCWEDPRVDRLGLDLRPTDNVLVITSAGCNALDYALCGPEHVYAVDMNPRQNALLDLKLAGIRGLEYEDFFRMFGYGHHPETKKLYREKLRPALPLWSRSYW